MKKDFSFSINTSRFSRPGQNIFGSINSEALEAPLEELATQFYDVINDDSTLGAEEVIDLINIDLKDIELSTDAKILFRDALIPTDILKSFFAEAVKKDLMITYEEALQEFEEAEYYDAAEKISKHFDIGVYKPLKYKKYTIEELFDMSSDYLNNLIHSQEEPTQEVIEAHNLAVSILNKFRALNEQKSSFNKIKNKYFNKGALYTFVKEASNNGESLVEVALRSENNVKLKENIAEFFSLDNKYIKKMYIVESSNDETELKNKIYVVEGSKDYERWIEAQQYNEKYNSMLKEYLAQRKEEGFAEIKNPRLMERFADGEMKFVDEKSGFVNEVVDDDGDRYFYEWKELPKPHNANLLDFVKFNDATNQEAKALVLMNHLGIDNKELDSALIDLKNASENISQINSEIFNLLNPNTNPNTKNTSIEFNK